MKEIRKRVSEPLDGDNVKGLGTVALVASGFFDGNERLLVTSRADAEGSYLPADAEVTVLVKERRWRIVFETASPGLAAKWLDETGEIRSLPDRQVISVEEVDA
jgi:hypothetical protein